MTFQVFSIISLFIIFSIYWWGLSFLYKRKYNVKKDNTLYILLNDRDIENLVGCTIKGNELIFFSSNSMLEGKMFFCTDVKSNFTHYNWLNYIYSNRISIYLKNQTKIYIDFLPPSINKAKLKFKIAGFNAVLHIKQKDKDLKIADYNLVIPVFVYVISYYITSNNFKNINMTVFMETIRNALSIGFLILLVSNILKNIKDRFFKKFTIEDIEKLGNIKIEGRKISFDKLEKRCKVFCKDKNSGMHSNLNYSDLSLFQLSEKLSLFKSELLT